MAPECSDCHELETLMPLGSLDHDHGRAQPLTEPTEEHSLMGNVGVGDDALGAELKVSSQDTRYHTRHNYKYSTFQGYLLSHVFLLTLSFSRLLGMGQLVVTGPTGSPNTGTITEDSPTLNNGTLDMATTENGKVCEQSVYASVHARACVCVCACLCVYACVQE